MNVSNHAATGAVIALVVKEPAIALPLAFVSHFCLDALPHFGYPGNGGFNGMLKHRLTYFMLPFEFAAWIFLIVLLHSQPLTIIAAALVAVSPDLVSLYRYLVYERKGIEPPAPGKITKLHWDLNWGERPWGLIVEASWFIGIIILLKRLL